MSKVSVVDIQHKTFKKQLQGYDRAEVDAFLDEVIESIEDEATARAALEADVADLRERISHFKAMEESLQHTLVLAQRTADEVKAAAHKEADLIKQEARMHAERQIADLGDRISEARREYQRSLDTAAQAKSELRSLLMSHLSLIDRPPAPHELRHAATALNGAEPAPAAASAPATAAIPTATPVSERPTIRSEELEAELEGESMPEPAPVLIRNGVTHTLVK
ncbi:MAG: DivIVA domain-containing protein [Candidatus Velthaea sp.]|jgi:cell division initiation protein